jgi:hypothetical protein
MDCEKLVAIMRRWGYSAITHQYLIDIYGFTLKEVEECTKGVGIDLGHWGLLYVPPLRQLSPPRGGGGSL